jgi:hypothetical protein
MANVVAKLRCLDHREETINTRWGAVTFDRDGLAELEVPEEELPMLRAVRPFSWLAEDHGPPKPDEPPPEEKASKPDDKQSAPKGSSRK